MKRLVPALLASLPLLAACYSPIYTDADDAKETCSALGHAGKALDECVARRQRDAECRKFTTSRDYTEAEARRRKCQ